MKSFALLSLLVCMLTSCQVYNSSSGDVVKFSDGAKAIIQNKCSQCHSYGTTSNAELITQGLIVPGSPSTSLLFQRIRGSNVGGNENMPPAGTSTGDVTTEELAILETWIQNL